MRNQSYCYRFINYSKDTKKVQRKLNFYMYKWLFGVKPYIIAYFLFEQLSLDHPVFICEADGWINFQSCSRLVRYRRALTAYILCIQEQFGHFEINYLIHVCFHNFHIFVKFHLTFSTLGIVRTSSACSRLSKLFDNQFSSAKISLDCFKS